MDRRRFAICSLVLAVLALAALPGLASARTAYVTGSEQVSSGGFVVPVDLAAAVAGSHVPIASGEGAPRDVAITPDGRTAYVADGSSAIVPVAVATNSAGAPVPAGLFPSALAISPDGKTAYVANPFVNQVTPVNLLSGTAGTPIPVGSLPFDVAITPDGSRAYVPNLLSNNVFVIDTATNAVVATIPVGSLPRAVAVTPNGATVYVTEGDGIRPINVATNTAGSPIPGSTDNSIAISPSGTRAYVVDNNGEVVPVDLAAGNAGSPFPVAPSASAADLAFLPDGSRAYAPFTAQSNPSNLAAINSATNAVGPVFAAAEQPSAIAIVPNQPPRAAFGSSPAAPTAGSGVAFDASGSTDSDGTVARYDWEFGDGTSAADAGPKPTHAFAKAGTYAVTLTTTDNEGCSTQLVFTGQTAYCNGSSVARTTHTVTVAEGKPCVRVKGNAGSFVPKRRPGQVVPGVRVLLSANAPARLAVSARIEWSRRHGGTGNVALGKVTVNIEHWRRIRFAIPDSLRDELPLGTAVTVTVKIETTPREASCSPTFTNRTLHLHVVKVFPDAVQAARPR